MTKETKLSSRGHHMKWPDPYQDENGLWWFYDPEIGWHNKERLEKMWNATRESLKIKDKIIGTIVITSTVENSCGESSFKDLWRNEP